MEEVVAALEKLRTDASAVQQLIESKLTIARTHVVIHPYRDDT